MLFPVVYTGGDMHPFCSTSFTQSHPFYTILYSRVCRSQLAEAPLFPIPVQELCSTDVGIACLEPTSVALPVWIEQNQPFLCCSQFWLNPNWEI